MPNAILKEKIIQVSKEIGIDKIGFTTANDFEYMRESLIKQKEAGHTTGFEHKILDERLNPELIFDKPKSIIAIAMAYPVKMHKRPKRSQFKRGQFARASWGEDYHFILRDKMNELVKKIEELCENDESIRFKPMTDTGELMDVVVAQRAGVGFIGKNGLLITKEFGSFVYLGEVITNIEFDPDTPMESLCGDCTRCIDACPPSALQDNGPFNARRCLSYQTQTKGLMDKEFRPMIRNVIYGCDICQVVCPFNRGMDNHFHERMEPDPEKIMPELVPILDMSNKEFLAKFGKMAGSWRGKKPIQRNAIIALANLKDTSSLPKLLQIVETDVRPMIRATAAYAVAELNTVYNEEIIEFLNKAMDKEIRQNSEKEIIDEYEAAIQKQKNLKNS